MTNVLLIQTIERRKNLEANETPLGLAYLAGYLRKYLKGVSINIVSSDSDIDIKKYNPDIVGITSVSQNFGIAMEMAEKVKQAKDIPVVIGGHHITALPHLMTDSMDAAVLGEGEETFLEIIKLVKEKKFSKENLAKINGVAFRKNKQLVRTLPRAAMELDKIPFPARDLLKNPGAHILSSRGCPYKCVFCSSSHFWKNTRFHSPEYVLREIQHLIKEYNPKAISFWDDLFTANKERVRKIADLIRKHGINKKVSFTVLARTNLVDDEICRILKSMNVTQIMCGFESGNQKTLTYLKGGSVTIEDNQRAVDLFKKYGFKFTGTFVIGSPHETRDEIHQTLGFIRRNDFEYGDTYLLTPLPGTPVWEDAKKRGLVTEDEKMDWQRLNIDFDTNKNGAIIMSEVLSRDELWKAYREFKKVWEEKLSKNKTFTEILKRFSIKDIMKVVIYNPRKVVSFATRRVKNIILGKK